MLAISFFFSASKAKLQDQETQDKLARHVSIDLGVGGGRTGGGVQRDIASFPLRRPQGEGSAPR